jgi:hypothetical protein
MLNTTDEIARGGNWSVRRSLVLLSLVGVGGWSLLAGIIWLSWR